jgi:hypothetical protein
MTYIYISATWNNRVWTHPENMSDTWSYSYFHTCPNSIGTDHGQQLNAWTNALLKPTQSSKIPPTCPQTFLYITVCFPKSVHKFWSLFWLSHYWGGILIFTGCCMSYVFPVCFKSFKHSPEEELHSSQTQQALGSDCCSEL